MSDAIHLSQADKLHTVTEAMLQYRVIIDGVENELRDENVSSWVKALGSQVIDWCVLQSHDLLRSTDSG